MAGNFHYSIYARELATSIELEQDDVTDRLEYVGMGALSVLKELILFKVAILEWTISINL